MKNRPIHQFLFALLVMLLAWPIHVVAHEELSDTVSCDTVAWKLYETGKATYYSSRMHGRKMASGERYDKNALSCAHKKLPFGTRIRVVNLRNGKEIVVVVQDRGPFGRGLVVDLSYRAAAELDMVRAGVVPVELWIEDN